jgi:hypothetical protein
MRADRNEAMAESATGPAWLIAAVGGTALWTATALLGGRAEPWDSGLYWTVSYPFALILAAGLGYLFPRRPWLWALLLIYSQLLVMAVSGSGLGLLPLGLMLLFVLSLPALVLAGMGAWIRRARAG